MTDKHIIQIDIDISRKIRADTTIIGKTYENKATVLKINITNLELMDGNFHLEFTKPSGEKIATPEIPFYMVESGFVGMYEVENNVLSEKGDLKCEIVRINGDEIWKSYTLTFTVLESINASGAYSEQYPDFISQAQAILDECERKEEMVKTDGDGTKFLSDDGTYKEVSAGGVEAITYIEGTTDNLIYIKNLETGVYVLNGKFKAFEGASATLSFTKALVALNKTTSKTYVQVIYPVGNRIQYMEITDDNSTITQIVLTSLLSRIEALEEKVG